MRLFGAHKQKTPAVLCRGRFFLPKPTRVCASLPHTKENGELAFAEQNRKNSNQSVRLFAAHNQLKLYERPLVWLFENIECRGIGEYAKFAIFIDIGLRECIGSTDFN